MLKSVFGTLLIAAATTLLLAFPALGQARCKYQRDCELDCRSKFCIAGVCDPSNFNQCLRAESNCKTVFREGCRTNPIFWQAEQAIKAAKSRNLLSDFQQCRSAESLATALAAVATNSAELAAFVGEYCGCIICDEQF